MIYGEKTREELIRELDSLNLRLKGIEHSFRECKDRCSAIYDQSPIAIEIYDSAGNLLQINPAGLALFGIKNIDEIKGFSLFADPNLNEDHKASLIQGKNVRYQGPFDFEMVKSAKLYSTSREGIIWIDVLITPMDNSMDGIEGYLIQIQDITDQKLIEEELRLSKEEYEYLFNYATVGLYRSSLNGEIVKANNAIFSMLGYLDEEDFFSHNQPGNIFIPHADKENFEEHLKRCGVVQEIETEWICKDGRVKTFRENAKITHYPSSNSTYIDGAIEDISERKRSAEILNEALERAEASDRLKTAFLNNISHEVRTPLNGILGFIELIDNPELTAEDRELYKDILHASSDRLLNTINSYMDISLLVSGNMSVNKSEFDLIALLNQGYHTYHQEAEAKGVTINLDLVSFANGIYLNSDRELVRKVYYHLLTNAVKFTEFGTVNIGISLMDGQVEISVEDSGIGIRDDIRDRIFDSFLQADLSNTRKHEGSGLGLAIAKGIVELIGGKIWVKSTLGYGSTFGFTVPGLTSPVELVESSKAAIVESGEEGPVILIVEDDPINIYLLESMLHKCRVALWHVENGQLAVDFCRNHPELSLVLMDLKMPVMDGFEATRQIKLNRPNLPVIAVTAFAMSGDRELALAAGCDDYLSKPFNTRSLVDKLREYCEI